MTKLPLAKVRKIARHISSETYWNFHVSLVARHARKLAKIKKADPDLTELAALLHDIGISLHGNADHEITGALESEKILRRLKIPQNVIDEVKHAITTHRGSKKNKPKTLIAKILRDADALSHFDAIPMLMYYGLREHKQDVGQATKWLSAKLDRTYKKIHFRESKTLARKKYAAAKLLLGENK